MSNRAKIRIEKVTYSYGANTALRDITFDLPDRAISVLFGPSGSGKTTLLRLINRLNDAVDGTSMAGHIHLGDEDIYDQRVDVPSLRRRVGMVFSLPLPLPGTIYDNVAYGPRLTGSHDRSSLDEIVGQSLIQAALWDEVKDRLGDPAVALSGGQQQRLCIARSLAMEPEVLLLDEPTSGLDPVSTTKVEQTLIELKRDYAVVLVPHSVQQGARIADFAAFLLMGELVEVGDGTDLFYSPTEKRTEDYVTGRFG